MNSILLGLMDVGDGGVAVATQAPPHPTLTVITELPDQDEYEVRIYNENQGRRLVAEIEIISPSNKDLPASRRAFVGKVAALLQHNVCVTLVDIVKIRQFNLYAERLELYDAADPAFGSELRRDVPLPEDFVIRGGRIFDRCDPCTLIPFDWGSCRSPFSLWSPLRRGGTVRK